MSITDELDALIPDVQRNGTRALPRLVDVLTRALDIIRNEKVRLESDNERLQEENSRLRARVTDLEVAQIAATVVVETPRRIEID